MACHNCLFIALQLQCCSQPSLSACCLTQEPELSQAVEGMLKNLDLWAGGVADKPVGKFSGGMKRRLSVGISLIGNPAAVYMDEPSTVSCLS